MAREEISLWSWQDSSREPSNVRQASIANLNVLGQDDASDPLWAMGWLTAHRGQWSPKGSSSGRKEKETPSVQFPQMSVFTSPHQHNLRAVHLSPLAKHTEEYGRSVGFSLAILLPCFYSPGWHLRAGLQKLCAQHSGDQHQMYQQINKDPVGAFMCMCAWGTF